MATNRTFSRLRSQVATSLSAARVRQISKQVGKSTKGSIRREGNFARLVRFSHVIAFISVMTLVAGLGLMAQSASAVTTTDSVLILNSSVTGGVDSIEASEVTAKGLTPVVVDDATWQAKTPADFATYRAIILGDATCASSAPAAAETTVADWGPAITGNAVIIGSDPVFHASQGGEAATRRSVDFAVDQIGKTGAYIALSCYYHDTIARTPVPMLDGLRPGGFTVTGVGCYDSAHIVATHPALAGLADDQLSNWSCSVHEAFDSWPADFTVLAIARDFGAAYTASDGTIGTPYILARGSGLRSYPLSLDPVSQSRTVATSVTATGQLLDGLTSAPVSGRRLSARVSVGPNAGTAVTCGTCITDATGHVPFTYVGRSAGTDTLQAWIDTDANGAPSPGEPQTTAAVTWTAAAASTYVALGDSYSSGEGNAPYQPDSDNPSNFDSCHRSEKAYGWLLHNDPQLTTAGGITFKACSGAVTEDVFSQNHNNPNGEPSQLSWLSAATKRVTLTIGGNDTGFANIIGRCVLQFGCSRTRLRTDTATRLAALAGKGNAYALLVGTPIHPILDVIRAIHTNGHAPNANILIGGYPQLFGSAASKYTKELSPSGRVCIIGSVHAPVPLAPLVPAEIDYRDAQWINDVIAKGNATIRDAVRAAKAEGIRVEYVSPGLSLGHGLCDTRERWINFLSVIDDHNTPASSSLHPNANGQGLGYFPAFKRAALR